MKSSTIGHGRFQVSGYRLVPEFVPQMGQGIMRCSWRQYKMYSGHNIFMNQQE